jgi:hypothetical protein
LLGVVPYPRIRPVISSSTMTSIARALNTSAIWSLSNRPGGASGSRAENEYSSSPSTTTSSRSKRISAFRSTSMPLLVQPMAMRKASSTAVNSGVNSRVSTGAMFSTTPCLASTSQPATTIAAALPQGSSHCLLNTCGSTPMAVKVPNMKAIRTPPPSPMST